MSPAFDAHAGAESRAGYSRGRLCLQLALESIIDNPARSWLIWFCVFIATLSPLVVVILNTGLQGSLHLSADQVAADLLIVPEGAETRFQTALLMGGRVDAQMPAARLAQIAEVPGVAQVSPLIVLGSAAEVGCCDGAVATVLAFDPDTDFTVNPWVQSKLGRPLAPGEAVGGADFASEPGRPSIRAFGKDLTLAATRAATGTHLDRILWVTWETAQQMARTSAQPADGVSAVMVKVAPGAKIHDAAVLTGRLVPGVTPIEHAALFQIQRQRARSLVQLATLPLILIVGLSLAAIGLAARLRPGARKRRGGTDGPTGGYLWLRAMGATRRFVLFSLLAETGLLALAGAVPAILGSVFVLRLLRAWLVRTLSLPYGAPSTGALLPLLLGALALALVAVGLIAFGPAWRISRASR